VALGVIVPFVPAELVSVNVSIAKLAVTEMFLVTLESVRGLAVEPSLHEVKW
jgi:hypothetical protein